MYTRTATILSEIGLNARAATLFIKEAAKYDSNILVRMGDREASAKSIIGVLSLMVPKGGNIEITAVGHDEKEAVDELVSLVDNVINRE